MTDLTTETAPKRIWLQVDSGALGDDRTEVFPADIDGVTWNDDEIGGLEVEYVRADIARKEAIYSADFEWIAPRMIAADFAWGEYNESVLIFKWPDGVSVSAKLGDCIERAKLAERLDARSNGGINGNRSAEPNM